MFLSLVEDVPHWQSLGVSLFLLGSDHGFLREGAAALRRRSGL
jgi:2-keto-3-deoxy-L-rhamnonate aldolase RhmA